MKGWYTGFEATSRCAKKLEGKTFTNASQNVHKSGSTLWRLKTFTLHDGFGYIYFTSLRMYREQTLMEANFEHVLAGNLLPEE